MKKLIPAFLLVFIAVLSFQCQKEISNVVPGNTNGAGVSPLTATLQGNVIDETGQPASGVAIKVGNKTASTDSKGFFRIVKASLDKNASVVTADKAGYFKAYRTFKATSAANHVMIKLVRKQLIGTIGASAGGEVMLSNGATIGLPANGVVKAAGGSYSGTVNVFSAYINPTASDIGQTVPGSFMADDANGKRVTLTSYGMLAVQLESSSGEKLQIASGSEAKLTAPIPASLLSSAPATIALWYVDEQTGIWKEEGVATKSGNNYIGNVKHFSFWNYDMASTGINLSLTLHNEEGGPLVHVPVKITRASYGSAYGYTDSLGTVSGLVPANEGLLLQVMDPCNNVVYSQNIGPYSQNTNLGVITVVNPGLSLVNVTGVLHNCSGGIVTNGYAVVSFENVSRYVNVNSNGQFAISFTRCNTSPATLAVTGVDNTNHQQGTVSGIAITAPVTNAGTINACGISTAQFINYTLDGTNYTISDALPSDSLGGYTNVMNATPYSTVLYGFSNTSINDINLRFNHTAAIAGTYPAVSVSVQQLGYLAPVPPFNIVVTNFPTAAGGFYEGSFSGQLRDSASTSTLHTLNGSFRVRRN